ncbi:hypothetical protein AK88_05377 [Plasmodium fragile]|uniref:Schizont-infected cell agglutination extracellular alpha domain-containing protein n=1 Tax=Plasmodium fragile TaxID=5857 RepID=A0A0D9QD55_PLAFR|nr:uncharacterized protein AK88_05377 [Plasmodium fragile]KJP84995.1 hypothetical protein AK88_05377 [Plasmodium fragile]
MGEKKPGAPPGIKGPVVEGKCTMCGYTGYTHNVEAVNLSIAQWLMEQGHILGEIQALETEMPCSQYWQNYIKGDAPQGDRDINKILTETGKEQKQNVEKDIKDKSQGVLEKAKKAVQDKIKEMEDKNTQAVRRFIRIRMIRPNTNTRPLPINGRIGIIRPVRHGYDRIRIILPNMDSATPQHAHTGGNNAHDGEQHR